jgi:hypothetical protein
MSLRILFLFAVAGVSATTAAQQQAPSPEVGTDRRVSFRLLAPNAREVRLSGEFMQGSTPLVKNEAGLWSVTVGPLEPEIYHYTFTVDGVRIIDPGNPAVKTGSTSSTLASVLEVRGDTPAFYDEQPVPHGDIRSHVYASRSLGTERRLTVYTPPGYEQDSKAMYPVLYLLHGANADENAWHRLGRVNLILDNLIAAGKARPFLIVMPFGYGIRPGGGRRTRAEHRAFREGPHRGRDSVHSVALPCGVAPRSARNRRPVDGWRAGAEHRTQQSRPVQPHRGVQLGSGSTSGLSENLCRTDRQGREGGPCAAASVGWLRRRRRRDGGVPKLLSVSPPARHRAHVS